MPIVEEDTITYQQLCDNPRIRGATVLVAALRFSCPKCASTRNRAVHYFTGMTQGTLHKEEYIRRHATIECCGNFFQYAGEGNG